MAKPWPEETSAWNALQKHSEVVGNASIGAMFRQDPHRFERFSLRENGLLLDYSKNKINQETMSLLFDLAKERNLEGFVARYKQQGSAIGGGPHLNWTERRAVLHPLLRVPASEQKTNPYGSNDELVHAVLGERRRIKSVADKINKGNLLGSTKKPITNVVHIGIGGSDLGPRLVVEALGGTNKPTIRFASNIDEKDLREATANLHPETTLFVVVSKSFTTRETLLNAKAALSWSEKALGRTALGEHFYAVTANPTAAKTFGIPEQNIFPFWNFVGGRTSVWSSVGLSIAMGLGANTFEALLKGAHDIDQHFFNAPIERNMPIVMALLGLWYRNFLRASSHAILPYAHGLRSLPAYLQQLDMESNGKSTNERNKPVGVKTAPVIWGGAATPSQHSFFQWLHQGTDLVPVDVVLVKTPDASSTNALQHKELLANGIAQTQALAWGSDGFVLDAILEKLSLSEAEKSILKPHITCAGNKPSTTLVLDDLGARNLGKLMALYEHKVAVQGLLWGINSFDQFGVEIGKILSHHIMNSQPNPNRIGADSSTQALIELCL